MDHRNLHFLVSGSATAGVVVQQGQGFCYLDWSYHLWGNYWNKFLYNEIKTYVHKHLDVVFVVSQGHNENRKYGSNMNELLGTSSNMQNNESSYLAPIFFSKKVVIGVLVLFLVVSVSLTCIIVVICITKTNTGYHWLIFVKVHIQSFTHVVNILLSTNGFVHDPCYCRLW